jgi:hypothetical protein
MFADSISLNFCIFYVDVFTVLDGNFKGCWHRQINISDSFISDKVVVYRLC